MTFRKVGLPKLSAAVIEEFEALILNGVLRPGDRLPPERELAEKLGVSRSSLREALDEMSAHGLVRKKPGSGVVVSELVASSLADPLAELIGRDRQALRDYLTFRKLIETDAAARAARVATSADRERIGELLTAMRAAHESGAPEREATLDTEFHMAIVDAAGNVVTAHVTRALGRLLRRGMGRTRGVIYDRVGVREALLSQHAAIADAILAEDDDGARAAAGAHLDYVEAEYRAAEDALRRAEWADRRHDRALTE